MDTTRGDHAACVIALTYDGKRNTRCNLLLLALPGGRVMGSNDQMTLTRSPGSPLCGDPRVRESVAGLR